LATALIWPGLGFAQLHLAGQASTAYEWSSNVYDLPDNVRPPGGREDGHVTVQAGSALDYMFSRQSLELDAQARRDDYDTFKLLNHTDYSLRGGLNWVLGPRLTGVAQVARARTMVQFLDTTNATQLLIDTQTLGEASVAWQLLPRWAVEGSGLRRTEDSPRPEAPSLTLHESVGQATVRYSGVTGFKFGLRGEYRRGDFENLQPGDSGMYHQKTGEVTAQYADPRSTLSGALGYTVRDLNVQSGHVAGTTGELSYQRRLTGKTEMQFEFVRVISTYINSAGSELDTSAKARLKWQATRRIGLEATYSWTHGDFTGQQSGFGDAARTDRFQDTRITLEYRALSWLSILPYAQFEDRHSTIPVYAFSSNVVGIRFEAQLGAKKKADAAGSHDAS
jgi:hypothetical protein